MLEAGRNVASDRRSYCLHSTCILDCRKDAQAKYTGVVRDRAKAASNCLAGCVAASHENPAITRIGLNDGKQSVHLLRRSRSDRYGPHISQGCVMNVGDCADVDMSPTGTTDGERGTLAVEPDTFCARRFLL